MQLDSSQWLGLHMVFFYLKLGFANDFPKGFDSDSPGPDPGRSF